MADDAPPTKRLRSDTSVRFIIVLPCGTRRQIDIQKSSKLEVNMKQHNTQFSCKLLCCCGEIVNNCFPDNRLIILHFVNIIGITPRSEDLAASGCSWGVPALYGGCQCHQEYPK